MGRYIDTKNVEPMRPLTNMAVTDLVQSFCVTIGQSYRMPYGFVLCAINNCHAHLLVNNAQIQVHLVKLLKKMRPKIYLCFL